MKKTVALIAHDRKKEDMLSFVLDNKEQLAKCQLIATATTGRIISEQAGLAVTTYLSGPLGGDQQIGSKVACNKVDIVIFLPRSPDGPAPRTGYYRSAAPL